MRRIWRALQIVLLGLCGLYACDYLAARYRIPNNRQILGSVQVQTLYAVRQKSGRIEYLMGDTAIEPCVVSLFPHMGYVPCWYLSRHTTKRIEIGRIDSPSQTSSYTDYGRRNTVHGDWARPAPTHQSGSVSKRDCGPDLIWNVF